MAYWGYDFCVSTTSNIGWPQQPLTEKISDIRLKIGFLIVPYTKRDFYWSFWCQGWSNHQNEEKYWGNRAVEAVEAIEVAEADEVNEAAEVSRGWKMTKDDFRLQSHPGSWIQLIFTGNALGIWICGSHWSSSPNFQQKFFW